jgi:hypothetical protein
MLWSVLIQHLGLLARPTLYIDVVDKSALKTFSESCRHTHIKQNTEKLKHTHKHPHSHTHTHPLGHESRELLRGKVLCCFLKQRREVWEEVERVWEWGEGVERRGRAGREGFLLIFLTKARFTDLYKILKSHHDTVLTVCVCAFKQNGALGRHTQYNRLQSTCHTHHLSRLPFGFFAPLWRADQARTIAVPLHCQTQRCALGL